MPIDARCPSCQAAVPSGAAWCSLCHRDLRPEPPAPAPAAETVPATGPVPGPSTARRGRHARPDSAPVDAEVPVSSSSSPGRHSTATLALLEGVAVPTSADADDHEVEAYAEAMLTRLRIADPTPQLADPGSFPGGRWGLAAVAMVGVTLVLLALGAVAGAVLG